MPAGTLLHRVHNTSRPATEFNATPRPAPLPGAPITGGRFDSPDGTWAYLYAAFTEPGAFAETFARNLDWTRAGPRPLPKARVTGKAVSRVELARDVNVVEVHGPGAAQIGQDDWLTRCDEDGYPLCRQWAAAIRAWEPDADGLLWHSKRDPGEEAIVLWADPADPAGLLNSAGASEPLDSGPAAVRLQAYLARWRVYLEP